MILSSSSSDSDSTKTKTKTTSAATSSSSQFNHEKSQIQLQLQVPAPAPAPVQTENPSDLWDEDGLEEWEYVLDENLEQILKTDGTAKEKQAPSQLSKSASASEFKTFQQDLSKRLSSDAPQVLMNFLPEQLKCSNYFYYQNLKDELELVQGLLKTIFPAQDTFLGVETHYLELSRMIRDKNEENKLRNEMIQHELRAADEIMWKSEFQRLKEMAEKCAPEPINLESKSTLEIHSQYFGSLLNSIMTEITNTKTRTTTPAPTDLDLDLDLQFQKECHESSFSKADSLRKATIYAQWQISSYARGMKKGFKKNGYFPSEMEFTHFHETTLLASYNQSYYVRIRAINFQAAWTQLGDDLKSAVLEYTKKYAMKNRQLLEEQDQLVEKLVDFSVEKYVKDVQQAKTQCLASIFDSGSDSDSDLDLGSKIFKPAQLYLFHTKVHSNVYHSFNNKSARLKYELTRDRAWNKLKEQMKQIKRADVEENERKIKRLRSLQKYVGKIAEDAYQKMMKRVFSSSSGNSSKDPLEIEETQLEYFHGEAVKWARDFYMQKLEKLDQFYCYPYYHGHGIVDPEKDKPNKDNNKDMIKAKETLESKCAEMKLQLLREHKKSLSVPVAVAKETEAQEEKPQQQKETESLQQKPSSQNDHVDIHMSNVPVQNSPLHSKDNTEEDPEGAGAGTSSKIGAPCVADRKTADKNRSYWSWNWGWR